MGCGGFEEMLGDVGVLGVELEGTVYRTSSEAVRITGT